MLIIRVPKTYTPERCYIINTVMQDFLGLACQLLIEERQDVLIEDRAAEKSRTLRMADVLFQTRADQWLTPAALPSEPLANWDISREFTDMPKTANSLPVIYGSEPLPNAINQNYVHEDREGIFLRLDIFGSAFFMLTRYEEYVKADRDRHARFPADASLAGRENFLDRPIINEYLEILWQLLRRLWPGLERKPRSFRVLVSHDIDIPFAQLGTNVARLIRSCGADILLRRSPDLAWQRTKAWKAVQSGDYKQDLNYTYDRLMDISEKNDLKSAFYFTTACSNPAFDFSHDIGHPGTRQLLREIASRGHEIGLHTSYDAFSDLSQTRLEFQKLLEICSSEGIQQDAWGGRQHYLRWQPVITWRNWAAAGLNYDSTLAYPEQIGFRCGICYDYRVFDLELHKKLTLTERPLIVMEETVMREDYMGISSDLILGSMNRMKQNCRTFNGNFTLLWHNNTLNNAEKWALYEQLLSG